MTLDVKAAKRKLALMVATNAVSLLAALGALVVYFHLHLDWALKVFAAIVLVGLGAQIWFVASFRRARKGA